MTPGPPNGEVAEELDALRAALAPEVDEEVVSAQWFRPPGWGSGLKGLARGLGRLVPGAKDPQQQCDFPRSALTTHLVESIREASAA